MHAMRWPGMRCALVSLDRGRCSILSRLLSHHGADRTVQVVTGWTAVDESMVTGESMPVSKAIGDKVVAGTVNTTGLVHVRAEGVGEQTMLANIIKLVEDAQTSKAPIQVRLSLQLMDCARTHTYTHTSCAQLVPTELHSTERCS